ncbi:hypothetical protein LSH36_1114g00028 [Paralvinella palmiformis]|uniref:Uncharacterized protein n=1 Tax=Paralvinella palmiformis TaxID=53620 RepID=A0AAD9IVI1_9ANNE|nr:hypothetical protein LSH36_1114g00028 [Paralvinella palmiformis]
MSDSDESFDILGDFKPLAKKVTDNINCEKLAAASAYVDPEQAPPTHITGPQKELDRHHVPSLRQGMLFVIGTHLRQRRQRLKKAKSEIGLAKRTRQHLKLRDILYHQRRIRTTELSCVPVDETEFWTLSDPGYGVNALRTPNELPEAIIYQLRRSSSKWPKLFTRTAADFVAIPKAGQVCNDNRLYAKAICQFSS